MTNAWLLDKGESFIRSEGSTFGNYLEIFVFSFTYFVSRGLSLRIYISSLRNDSLPSPVVPRYLQVSDPEVDKKKLTEEINSPVALCGVRCTDAAHGDPLQLWISRTPSNLRWEALYYIFLRSFRRWGGLLLCRVGVFSAVGILHCSWYSSLPATHYINTIFSVHQAQSRGFIVNSGKFLWSSLLSLGPQSHPFFSL